VEEVGALVAEALARQGLAGLVAVIWPAAPPVMSVEG
jgi:hypothetical protein